MTIKKPVSLRQRISLEAQRVGASVGVVAACFAAADCASAQTPTSLPTMNVEAAAAPKPKPKPRRQAGKVNANAANANAAGNAAETSATAVAPAPDANPYADPRAPYKVNRSASSRIQLPLAEAPRTITAIPKEVIEDKGATSMRDLVRTTPGLTLGTGEGGNAFGDRVFIRGFDARNDMFINGVRESGVSTRETFQTEQVEVIKGPAGTLAGRGAAGGAINVVTKQPGPVDFTEMTAMGGTDLTRRLTFDVNRNVSPDLTVRVNGLFHEANVAGRDHVFDNRYGGSLAVQWRPLENFRANVDYYYVKFNQMPDWGVPFDPRTRRPFTESGLDRNNFYGLGNRDFQKNSQHLATTGFEWKADESFSVTSKVRYGHTVTDYVATKLGTPNLTNADPSLWTVSASPASRYQINETVANQTEATKKFDTGAVRHTVVTGVEIQRENISQDTYTGLAAECYPDCSANGSVTTNLFSPANWNLSVANAPLRSGSVTTTGVNTLAAYALDTLNWNDRVFLTLGARADRYGITRNPFNAASASRDDLLFNWNVGLTYKVAPNGNVYAAYATSSNPVGSELDGTSGDYGALTAANSVLRPERNTSAEIGSKWEFVERRLLLTGGLFETTKRFARETVGSGQNAVIQDTAAYRVRGMEFGATGNVSDAWSLFGGAVFMDSKVTDTAIAANLGRPLANIAHVSFNLLSKYRLTNKLTIGGQGTWKGEVLGGTLAATSYAAGMVNVGGVTVATPAGYNKLPNGWRFDMFSEYAINKTITAKLQVTNIFDKKLYDGFYRSGTPFVYIAPGRSAQLSIQAKF